MSAAAERTPLLRLFAALFYDLILLFAVLFFAALAILVLLGEDFGRSHAFQLYLYAIGLLYFTWFWTHGGQTLGLRTWRLRVTAGDGHSPVDWRRALLRALAAQLSWLALGLGYLWALWDRNGLTWHDRLSGTRVVRVP
ncbi:MAG TPA: RDD family protein [Chromatiales bacterium]|nr:RDD family protein [Chromatiales bacterium]